MSDFFQKKPHREPLELQLTAMIDIFSMMVIFLIFGTVIGAQEFIFPEGMQPPVSNSKESTETAPQLTITKDKVVISIFNDRALPLSLFTSGQSSPQLDALSEKIKDYVSKSSEQSKKSGNLLNVIADRETHYKTLFDVVKVFKAAGFDTLLFITRDEKGAVKGS
jgi:biopolymer transport protein ExbD